MAEPGFPTLAWLFALAVTLHNAEEAIWLPRWSASAGRFHVPVSARQFRFAVLVLTIAAWTVVAWSAAGSRIADYLVSGYALAMLVNVVFPHLAATVALRRYAPGTATAVLLNLPVTGLLLKSAFGEGRVDPDRFLWAGPLVAIAVAGSIPVLFRVGGAAGGQKP